MALPLHIEQLRHAIVQRFPSAAVVPAGEGRVPSLREPVLWVEVAPGQGGLAWLAAWTLLQLADDPLGRPALWVDTHTTQYPGDLLDLEGRLVVVRPEDPGEAHIAADIALRSGSFSIVALELHRSVHPTSLARLTRLARHDRGLGRTSLVLFGVPPPFLSPPSGVARTSFGAAVTALVGDPRLLSGLVPPPSEDPDHVDSRAPPPRAPHTTDRLRPLDRAPDRRPSPSAGPLADALVEPLG